ncbi:MAG TPA: phosphatase PAP2 family protein [Solirubrobacteraceae bacterium]|nr:phosphatase PAP2 family protein [Solirubrobacteraceae bacterium]
MLSRARTLQARLFPQGVLDVLRQILLFMLAYYAYRIVRGWVDDPAGAAKAFQNARDLIGIERSLHVFAEQSIQSWADTKPALIDAANWIYLNAQTSVTVGALVYLYLFHNKSFYFVRNMFVVAMGLALVAYVIFPTAPPRFFPEWGFLDTVSDYVHVDHNSVTGANALFNPYAAVPSMHICFATMIGVPIARLARHRATRIFWACYPLLMTFVIVATANHFFTDAFLGALTAGIAALAARSMARARPVWGFHAADASAPA